MSVTIINIPGGSCDDFRPLTRQDLLALEAQMSTLSDKLAALKTSIDELKTRVEAGLPAQADLDAIDAMKTEVDSIVPAPVPTPEPTPEPSPTPTPTP